MLFVLSLAFILFIFGLGYVVTLCLPQNDEASLAEKFPLILTGGFLANHLIVLSIQSLRFGFILATLIALIGLVLFFIHRENRLNPISGKSLLPFFITLVIFVLYYFTILSKPLEWWDARSIWFFHAKMIWSADTINLNAGWHHPSIPHPDYPKLVPVLTAEIASLRGYWNEYFPKLSLFLLLIPPVCWIMSFYRRHISFLFLVLFVPFGLRQWLWNGSMDGYLSLYTAAAMLLAGRYVLKRNPLDLISAAACLALMTNVKNEGLLIALIGIVCLTAALLLSDTFTFAELKKNIRPGYAVWLGIMVTPCLLWSVVYKYQWPLTNDLGIGIGTGASFSRIINRLYDGKPLTLIIEKTFFHDWSALFVSFLLFGVSLSTLKMLKQHNAAWIPAATMAGFYYCGMVAIYLLTPGNLKWYLDCSVQRIMPTVSSSLIVAIYFIMNHVESAGKSNPP